MSRVIEIIERTEGEGYGWTVIAPDGRFADSLGHDEALWVVAQLLMGTPLPRYVKSYEEYDRWERRYPRTRGEQSPTVALLPAPQFPPYVARTRVRVARTFDELGQLVNLRMVPR